MTDKDPNDEVQAALANLARVVAECNQNTTFEPSEYEAVINALPPEQREAATQATGFAKLWEYLSDQNRALPTDVMKALRELPKLPPEERVAQLRRINESLLEYECDSEDPQLRQ